jgi:hypothetical protein
MNRIAIQDRDRAIYLLATDTTTNMSVKGLGDRYGMSEQHINRIIKKEHLKAMQGKCGCCKQLVAKLYTIDMGFGTDDVCFACSLAWMRGGK